MIPPFVYRIGLLAVLGVGTALSLTGLDNGCLWQDEAETAVLGKGILTYGYPRAFDGVNRLNPGLSLQEGYAWTYHSWLPMYLAAASFFLGGATTTSARLPFALLGVGCLWLTYLAARRLTGSRGTALLTGLFLMTCVPFLLHMRQCRYYAPAVFFTLLTVIAYLRFLKGRPFSFPALALSLLFLFHADHGVFAPIILGLILHALFSRPGPRRGYRFAAAILVVLALTVPWAVYLEGLQHHGHWGWERLRHHAQFYFRQINKYLVPILFWLLVAAAARPSLKGLWDPRESTLRQGMGVSASLLGTGLVFLVLFPDQRHFRYLLFLVPFMLLVQSVALSRLFRTKPMAAAALTLLLIGTDLLHHSGLSFALAQIPGVRVKLSTPNVRPRSLLLEFLGELSHPYRGPMDGVVELLLNQAQAGQTLKIPYEDHPILFYTRLKVEPVVRMEDFGRPTYPDWIVLRRDWLPEGFFESPYYQKIQADYESLILDAPDIPWQNRPDPGFHRFRTDRKAPPVVVFKRR